MELIGITTVYGHTTLRAQVAKRYAAAAGRTIPVYAGRVDPLSRRDVWMAGHEGSLPHALDGENTSGTDAVTYLTETVSARDQQISLVAIGPLTTVAAALDADARFERPVRDRWIMGGSRGKIKRLSTFRNPQALQRRAPTVAADADGAVD